MSCELLDFRCFFVSEIVGDAVLATVLATLIYFIVASKLRLGFDTTIFFALPLLFIASLAISGFSAVFAFATVFIGLLLAFIINKMIGN